MLTSEQMAEIREEYARWLAAASVSYKNYGRAWQADVLARRVPDLLAEIERLRGAVQSLYGQLNGDCESCAYYVDGDCDMDNRTMHEGCGNWEAK